MTDVEFREAYDIAYGIVSKYVGLSEREQVEAVSRELGYIRHASRWEYSMTARHYNNAYGFFVLNRTSCAGDVRAAALCLAILGIPYEHVNENQNMHQWVRVRVNGRFMVLDVNASIFGSLGYLAYEQEPYKHPWIDGITVLLDGRPMEFDVHPRIINERTMVPLRAIFEALGADISWNNSTQTVTATKGDTVIVLTIGCTSPTVNGRVVTIDQPGVVVDGRTLVPLRFVAEALGVAVNWFGMTRTVTITS
jgi:hypothetical protein